MSQPRRRSLSRMNAGGLPSTHHEVSGISGSGSRILRWIIPSDTSPDTGTGRSWISRRAITWAALVTTVVISWRTSSRFAGRNSPSRDSAHRPHGSGRHRGKGLHPVRPAGAGRRRPARRARRLPRLHRHRRRGRFHPSPSRQRARRCLRRATRPPEPAGRDHRHLERRTRPVMTPTSPESTGNTTHVAPAGGVRGRPRIPLGETLTSALGMGTMPCPKNRPLPWARRRGPADRAAPPGRRADPLRGQSAQAAEQRAAAWARAEVTKAVEPAVATVKGLHAEARFIDHQLTALRERRHIGPHGESYTTAEAHGHHAEWSALVEKQEQAGSRAHRRISPKTARQEIVQDGSDERHARGAGDDVPPRCETPAVRRPTPCSIYR